MAMVRTNIAPSIFAIDIGGSVKGYAKSVKGFGKVTYDVHESKVGAAHITKKMIANQKYGDVTVELGMAMGKDLYNWINMSFTNAFEHRDGAIIVGDHTQKAIRRLDFMGALIQEVSLPKLEGSSKDAMYMTVKLMPETLKHSKGQGDIAAPLGENQKMFINSNFHLDIGGLDCSTVTSIDSLKWSQQMTSAAYGHLKEVEQIPSGLKFEDLKVTFGIGKDGAVFDAWVKALESWHAGGSTEKDHKAGTLTFLAQDMSTPLGTVTFTGLGIKEFAPADLERGDKLYTCTVTFYCEEAKLDLSKANA